ncbi:hypothetical protein XELAEV_18012034mg [Xenopus laevis]|uniref:Uncharacterized protein n=1 Tax=Xenopus laevis TaxID=8355 RepID=A0A974DLY3_XENLA|nr:hypothetical protein XELAEV_18012034mg [Xenopus laevis]
MTKPNFCMRYRIPRNGPVPCCRIHASPFSTVLTKMTSSNNGDLREELTDASLLFPCQRLLVLGFIFSKDTLETIALGECWRLAINCAESDQRDRYLFAIEPDSHFDPVSKFFSFAFIKYGIPFLMLILIPYFMETNLQIN